MITELNTGVISAPVAKNHKDWPRFDVDETQWVGIAEELAREKAVLLGLWGDHGAIHMAVYQETANNAAIFTLACPKGSYPSVGNRHAPAQKLERAAQDLFGLSPHDSPDTRPWFDHGRWGLRHPLGAIAETPASGGQYEFLTAEGEGMHQIPVGPVHAGIIEPGHFRFTANGETVVRLEARLGYAHKGIEGLMAGASLDRAANLAARTSGDSTVAYSFAFSRAVEAALETELPPRAVWLRALMAEIERLANHIGDIGAVCNDASFALMHAHCSVLRERVLRAANTAFGHRMMQDRIIPGGVTTDLTSDGFNAIRALCADFRRHFPALVELYDYTTSLQDRTVTTGRLSSELARRFGAGGFVGRASGRSFDARRALPYAPYDALSFEVPVREDGDVNARVWIRVREVEQSLSLIDQILGELPEGAIYTHPGTAADPREGVALVEGFRGDILAWLRIGSEGLVERCHLRDPSWFQWPLLEAAIEGNIVADFPLCNKSFNCSYSGHDL